MIPAINSSDYTTNFNGNIKLASNKTLSRLHYIKFLKAEDKFYKSTEDLERHMNNWSLLVPMKAAKAIKDFGKLLYERCASAYYFNKK